MSRYYSKTPDDPDTWGAVGSAGAIGRPAPAHTMTKPAQQARKAVRAFAAERNAQRAESAEGMMHASNRLVAAELAERIDLDDLTGTPRDTARRLEAIDARVAATRSRDGKRLSVWAITPSGRRVRALYKRTATGYGSDGVLIDRRAVGVTAALAELEGDRAMPR